MNDELDKYYEDFIKLYKADKVHFSWRKNSFVLSIDEAKENIDKEVELKDFISKLVNTLRQKILTNVVDKRYEQYEKYANMLLKHDSEIKSDIITRIKSNINICNNIYYEVLTKRDKKLDPECYSVLVNLNLEEPNYGENLLKQVNFELSIKDLKLFNKVINHAIKDIEKLNHNLE